MKKSNKYKKENTLNLKKMLIIFTIIIMISIFSIPYISIAFFKNISTIASNVDDDLVLDTSLAKIINPTNYGDWANYPVDLNDNGITTDDWKIFYNDGTTVYLIAADYLKASKIPEEAGMTTNGEYNAYWKDDSNFAEKQGMGDLSTDVANRFMLRKYKNDIEYANVTDINSKATAILLDTNIWKDFALGFPGSFAYGSPTVEMWVDSWNQKGYGELYDKVVRETDNYTFSNCNDSYVHYYETKGYGYRVGTTENNPVENLNISADINGYNDELYFPHTSALGTTEKYWFATPTYREYQNSFMCPHQAECVFKDTDITISLDGSTKEAQKLHEGDTIVYYNIDTNSVEEGTIEKVYIHSNAKSFVQYTFNDGKELKVTDYHPIYTKEGWKSFTERNGYPKPQIGDEVKTIAGWKTITNITTFSGEENCYDFSVKKSNSEDNVNNYFANDTLVQSAIDTKPHETGDYGSVLYNEFSMDCLVSCSYEGIVGGTRLNIEESNAAIRPIVVLPTSAIGCIDNQGVWHLGEESGKLIVHHYLENENEEETENVKLAEDEIKDNLADGYNYVTTPLSPDKYDTDKYEYTGRHTGDETEGQIVAEETKEVTYWYKEKTHKITTEVKGIGGHITGEGQEKYEEVKHLNNSTKDIVVTPDEGYHIKSITINENEVEFTENEDGTYMLPKFERMTEDKHIVVEFEKTEVEPSPSPSPTPSPSPDPSPSPTPSPSPDPTPDQNPSGNQSESGNKKPQETLPQTGERINILGIIVVVFIFGTISFIKYKKLVIK